MEILLNAEKLGSVGPLPITNTLVASTCVVIFLVVVALLVRSTKYNLKSGFYNFVEMVIEGIVGFIEDVVGRGKVAAQIFAVVVTFFLFIIVNNWFGLFPGFSSLGFYESKEAIETEVSAEHTNATAEKVIAHPEEKNLETSSGLAENSVSESAKSEEHSEELIFVPLLRSANSDLNMTLAIALISVVFIQIIAIRNIGFKHYVSKFFNFGKPFPILLFVGILELLSEIIKIFSFAFRLFGNIFSGDVLLIVIFGLVPYVAPLPFMAIELFAGFIQALIFTMLTLVFIKTSVTHAEH